MLNIMLQRAGNLDNTLHLSNDLIKGKPFSKMGDLLSLEAAATVEIPLNAVISDNCKSANLEQQFVKKAQSTFISLEQVANVCRN